MDAATAAQALLGCTLISTIGGKHVAGRIVETEAYDQTDAASHSWRGRTPRTDIMFGPAGHLYVYFTYGMHYCCNVVVGEDGYGAAVLIRALEPLEGIEIMRSRRGDKADTELTNGPAKLCQAFGIDRRVNGCDLRDGNVRLLPAERPLRGNIIQTTRIGITQAKDMPWRWYIKNNPYISRS